MVVILLRAQVIECVIAIVGEMQNIVELCDLDLQENDTYACGRWERLLNYTNN